MTSKTKKLVIAVILIIILAPTVFSFFHQTKIKEIDLSTTERRILERKTDTPNVIVKFDSKDSKAYKQELEKRGIKFLNYVGDKSWVLSVPKNEVIFLKGYEKAIVIRDVKYEDKVYTNLKTEYQPSWVDNGDDTWNLLVACYENIDLNTCKKRLENYGEIDYSIGLNSFVIKVDKNKIQLIAEEDFVLAISRKPSPIKPHLDESKITIGANLLQVTPYNLNGDGVIVAMFEASDKGATRPDDTHSDLTGRILYGDNTGSPSEHATQVAGILGGAGNINSSLKGIAPKVRIISYNALAYPNSTKFENAIGLASTIAQNSFGEIVDDTTCDGHGNYDIAEANIDNIVKGSLGKPLVIVFSAGNERDPPPCPIGSGGYNTTTQHSTAKNVITVGATNSNDNLVTLFTSFGPTDDGRVKPDLMAPGSQSNNDGGITTTNISNKYGTLRGTSLAAPHVSGTIALMLEHLKNLYPSKTVFPSSIKALLIDTANDVISGIATTGPDYASGYGVINSTAAVNRITFNNFEESTLYDNQTVQTYILVPPNESKLRVTLIWDDRGQPGSITKKLINDLDLTLIAPNGSLYYPWTLDPNNPSVAAVRNKRDDTNNVEQVVVDNPISGQWIIKINESDLPYDQNYSLVSTFLNTNLPTIGTTTKIIGHNQEWKGFINVQDFSNKKFTVDLNWNTQDRLDLTLISPSGQQYSNVLSTNHPQSTFVNSPSSGIWTVKVAGTSVNGFTNFDINTKKESLPNPPGGINFTFTQLNYISACNTSDEGLTVVLKGESNSSKPIVDISNKTNMTSKAFVAGLVIPNHKMLVNLPLGKVDVDQFLAQTEAGRVMLDADVKLKFSAFNTQAAKDEYKNIIQQLYSLYEQSPYVSEIKNSGYDGYPSWEAATWISPNSLKAEGEGCKIFLTNTTLKVESKLKWSYSNIDGFNVRQEAKDDVNTRFNSWKGNLTQWLNNNALRAQAEVNSDSKYDDLRYVYASVALAQWYKTLDRSQILFGNIIDSNDIYTYDLNISFDQSYWEQQANQRITENINLNSCFKQGWTSCYAWIYGGVVYINLNTNITSVLSNETKQVVSDAVSTVYSQKSDDNNSFFYANFIEVKKPELEPLDLWFTTLKPHTEKSINISVAIENKGNADAKNFTVNFYYNYTNVNGTSAIYPIGIVYNQNVSSGGVIVVKKEWNSGQLGSYEVFAEADYNNNVSERNELNNLIRKSIERITPYPAVNITSPNNNYQAIYYEKITLAGIATDLQDGSLPDSAFNWTSNIDGYLGSGTTLITNLSPGAKIITLIVTDSEGYKGTDTISLGILPSKPPVASLISPVSRAFAEGETIYFNGGGKDEEDGTNLQYTWNSSLDGLLGDSKSFSTRNLSVGNHIMSFGVIDSTSLKIYFVFNITISEGSPIVKILKPINNEEISFKVTTNFSGNGSDIQDGNISSSIIWTSSTNGNIGNGNSFNYNLSIGTHIITATALDTHGNIATDAITVTVKPPQYPTASIISPRNKQVFTHGDNITFTSSYSDFEDYVIPNSFLIWNSSIISIFGNGTNFIKPNVSIGNHTISFIVTDSDSMSSAASVNITVNPAPPVPSIKLPAHGSIFGQTEYIIFNGTATDYEDGTLSSDSLNWTSNKNGFLGYGNFLNLTNLPVGTHLITLTANDSSGLRSAESVNIIVVGLGNILVNKFSDGLTVKNLNFTASMNKTVHVNLPKNANISYAGINVRGYSP